MLETISLRLAVQGRHCRASLSVAVACGMIDGGYGDLQRGGPLQSDEDISRSLLNGVAGSRMVRRAELQDGELRYVYHFPRHSPSRSRSFR